MKTKSKQAMVYATKLMVFCPHCNSAVTSPKNDIQWTELPATVECQNCQRVSRVARTVRPYNK